MRGFLFTLGSFAVTVAVVGNAWAQKKQFYPTVVYLTKSSPCMAVSNVANGISTPLVINNSSLQVLYVQAFVFVLLLGKLMRKIFFGQLRAAETEVSNSLALTGNVRTDDKKDLSPPEHELKTGQGCSTHEFTSG